MTDAARYDERLARVRKVINLEPVDRLPVIYMGLAFAPRYMGMRIADFCADPEAALQVTLAAIDRLGGLDGVNAPSGGRITPQLTALWLSRLEVPGRDLPPDSLWQVHEAEVMTIDDYDTILDQGWRTFLRSYWPRVIDANEFEEAASWSRANAERVQQAYRDRGYVIVRDVTVSRVSLPFEYLCGGRSMQKFILDLHRIPDKVQAVMDVMFEDTLAQVRAAPRPTGIGGTWIGGWRSASALLAPRLWDRFVWPYILKLTDALVAAGITPVFHLDQDWTRDLARFREVTAKKCIMNPDGMTDMRKFKELLGDRMAMMGDVPASLLAAGSPEDVRRYIRELVDLFEGKGLLLCPGCDAPINAKPENMEAFVAASQEYGKVA